jgi:2-methylisocitrate lyase-like PEP mutase family enzyme
MVDGETGFGHALNTYRAVREFIELGFAGIQVDDLDAEVCPYIGQPIKLVPIETMERRIRTVIEARGDEDFVVEATTTCEDETRIERIVRYAEAGADVIAAVWRSEEQLRETAAAIEGSGARLVAVCFPLLPYLTWEQFGELGIALIKYPVELMYAGALAQIELLKGLKATTTLEGERDRLLDHEAYLELVGNAEAASLITHLNRPIERVAEEA